MANRDIVVIGASAGGFQPLVELLAPLPIDLPAAILLVVHTAAEGSGLLPELLERKGAWNTRYAEDGSPIEYGHVYIAPPDHHLLATRSGLRVTKGPRENRFRPAVDPLFRTAARAFGPRVIGIILSGGLDDGTHGLELIKRHGGLAIAQDPQDAVLPTMPMSAIQNVAVDHILSPAAIAAKLPFLVREEVTDATAGVPEGSDVAEGTPDNLKTGHVPGPPSPYTCPECGGALWELEDGCLVRFRCHVGHSFTADSLAVEQNGRVEQILWAALRALEEQAALWRRLASHAEDVGRASVVREFEDHAKHAERRASDMRRMLLREELADPARMAEKATASNGRRDARKRRAPVS